MIGFLIIYIDMKYKIVGINNIAHIMENIFDCDSFACQYDIIINGIWKGILNKAWFLVIPSISLGDSEIYKYIFAGNTDIKSKMIPHDANFLVWLNNNKIPSNISIRPLINTTSFLKGILGGTMAIKNSGSIKCLIPIIIYNSDII